jgi:hypothetical protein
LSSTCTGIDLGSPVSLDYFDRRPFQFDGKIESATSRVSLAVKAAGTCRHMIKGAARPGYRRGPRQRPPAQPPVPLSGRAADRGRAALEHRRCSKEEIQQRTCGEAEARLSAAIQNEHDVVFALLL